MGLLHQKNYTTQIINMHRYFLTVTIIDRPIAPRYCARGRWSCGDISLLAPVQPAWQWLTVCTPRSQSHNKAYCSRQVNRATEQRAITPVVNSWDETIKNVLNSVVLSSITACHVCDCVLRCMHSRGRGLYHTRRPGPSPSHSLFSLLLSLDYQ